jgi:serine/threonine protein kinase
MTWKTQFDLAEFREESKNLQLLNHFHIIQYFGSYVQQPSFAILLYPLCEYNLSDFMNICEAEDTQEVLSDPELLLNRLYLESFFPCLAQALKFIHNHTTRHADIKPANIVIKKRAPNVNMGRHYHIYIADFGSSSTYSYISQTTRFVAKTVKYCAPEVAPNSSAAGSTELKTWGRPADVFSLGCVYAEMLTVLACEEIISFDSFRAGNITLAGKALPRERGRTVDESFQGNLPRVGEWLQNLRRYEDADTIPGRGTRGYWYRRGNRVAFAPWKNTFAETIDVTESMLRHDQDARPKIAEVVKRLGVDDCCNREIIPLYAYSDVNEAK